MKLNHEVELTVKQILLLEIGWFFIGLFYALFMIWLSGQFLILMSLIP